MNRNMLVAAAIALAVDWISVCTASGAEPKEHVGVPETTDLPALLTFTQIRAAIRSNYGRLAALEVEYEQKNRNIRSSAPVVSLTNFHFAMKGERRYRSQRSAGSTNQGQSDESGLVLMYDGTVEGRLRPTYKQGYIVAEKQLSTDIDAYAQAMGIPLTDSERASVRSSSYFLPGALNAPDCDWQVEPTLERFDGVDCHVLVEKKQMQRILVDQKLGCAMRFREIRQAVDGVPASEWPLQARYAFRRHAQCADNLWMPKVIDIVAFVPASQPKNLWNKPDVLVSNVAKRVVVNESVNDSLLEVQFPIGTEVRDEVHGKWFRIGDARQEIDLLVEEGAKQLAVGRSYGWVWLIVLNGLLIVGLFLLFRYRKMAAA